MRKLDVSRFLKGGFRVKKRPVLKVNLNRLEKQNILTDLQQRILKGRLEACKKSGAPEAHISRIEKILEKPVAFAKVDGAGNPVTKKPETENDSRENSSPEQE